RPAGIAVGDEIQRLVAVRGRDHGEPLGRVSQPRLARRVDHARPRAASRIGYDADTDHDNDRTDRDRTTRRRAIADATRRAAGPHPATNRYIGPNVRTLVSP